MVERNVGATFVSHNKKTPSFSGDADVMHGKRHPSMPSAWNSVPIEVQLPLFNDFSTIRPAACLNIPALLGYRHKAIAGCVEFQIELFSFMFAVNYLFLSSHLLYGHWSHFHPLCNRYLKL